MVWRASNTYWGGLVIGGVLPVLSSARPILDGYGLPKSVEIAAEIGKCNERLPQKRKWRSGCEVVLVRFRQLPVGIILRDAL